MIKLSAKKGEQIEEDSLTKNGRANERKKLAVEILKHTKIGNGKKWNATAIISSKKKSPNAMIPVKMRCNLNHFIMHDVLYS